MSEKARAEHISQALKHYRDSRGQKDTYRIPLRGNMMLEVIDIPLDMAVLNPDSFRIAPQLEEHPQRELVQRNPYSPDAQQVISELVRNVHRHADDLKANLGEEGQTQPGVITRDGMLINANTRCVLLRELVHEGKISNSTIQVAVLPADITAQELLELEMLLQQQVELKDEYRLVNQLSMIRKLHDAGVSDDAIARKLRVRATRYANRGQRVRELREVLLLMERTRRLTDPQLSITAFASDRNQEQNWRELLREVKRLENTVSVEAADTHILGWLIAYLSGIDSVHKLRLASGDWVERTVIEELRQHHKDLHTAVTEAAPSAAEMTDGAASVAKPAGVELLGFDSEQANTEDARAKTQALANIVAKARQSKSDQPVTLPSGSSVSATDVLERVATTVKKAFAAEQRRAKAGTRVTRPYSFLDNARVALREAIDAIEETRADPHFYKSQLPAVIGLADEVGNLAAQVRAALDQKILTSHDELEGE